MISNTRTNTFSVLVPIFLLMTLLTCCDWVQKTIDETKQVNTVNSGNDNTRITSHTPMATDEAATAEYESEDQQKTNTSLFTDTILLRSIQASIKELPKFKGKAIRFKTSVTFYDYQGGYVSLDIQDPDNPENLDRYTYREGAWQPSKPVNTSGRSNWQQSLYNIDTLDFAVVSKVYQTAMEKSETVEGAEKITHIYLSESGKKLRWNLSIRGARKNYYLYFNKTGELTKFEQQ